MLRVEEEEEEEVGTGERKMSSLGRASWRLSLVSF